MKSNFQPDYRNILEVLYNRKPKQLPLYEHHIDAPFISNYLGKELEIQGVGYRAQASGKKLTVNVGYSHPVEYIIPDDVSISVVDNTKISVSGIDKQRVGQVAATIRQFRKPEPYKGKGIKYDDELVRRKEAKKK